MIALHEKDGLNNQSDTTQKGRQLEDYKELSYISISKAPGALIRKKYGMNESLIIRVSILPLLSTDHMETSSLVASNTNPHRLHRWFLMWFKVHLIYLNTETPKGAQVYSLTVWTRENHQVKIQSEIVPRNWLVSFFGEKWRAVYPLGQTKWLLILAESLERM